MHPLAQLAALFRYLQLFTHAAHHLTLGTAFLADHPWLGEIYDEFSEAHDKCVERMLGLGLEVDLKTITAEAARMYAESGIVDGTFDPGMFSTILEGDRQARDLIEQIFGAEGFTQGTLNMVAGLADESEVRAYKLTRRLKLLR